MNLRDKGTTIHLLFGISLWAKFVDGVLEIVGGILLFLVNPDQINHIVRLLTQNELSEDPNDFISIHLLHATNHLSSATKWFAAIFLLWHGVVKVALVWALLRRHLWAYPVATIAFGLFVAYQIYRYAHTHSGWLLVLTALDVFVIVITWLEYNRLRRSDGHSRNR
jgi:uncharacterized membrane protein